MTTTQLQEFARMGAEARLNAIAAEREAILRAFPDLGDGGAPLRRASSPPAPSRGRRRRRMSAAERRAVGKRMKAYWAKRRAEKAGGKKAAPKTKRKSGMSAEARQRQGERMRAYWAKRREEKPGSAEGGQAEAANGSGKSSGRRNV